MKKSFLFAGIIAAAAITSSCSITLPVSVSAAPIGSKVGISKTVVFFGGQMNKVYGISDAAKNGKITGGVATVDEKTTNCFFFQKKQLIVTGN